ncbi:MAG: molybdopterin molybdotransferase MoeA [bacterium JZ-2024 1]
MPLSYREAVEKVKEVAEDFVRESRPEKVPLEKALGRVLYEPITAPEPLPRFRNSAMDGFAVRAEDFEGASETHPKQARVIGDLPAGTFTHTILTPGTAIRVTTGSMVPEGSNAVIPQEEAEELNGMIRVYKPPAYGANIREAGLDVERFDKIGEPGVALGPAEIGLFASLGVREVPVYSLPRVSVLATGSELVDYTGTPTGAQVRDSSRIMISSGLEFLRLPVHQSVRSTDDPHDLRQAIDLLLLESDVLLITGGASVGPYDIVKDVLNDLDVSPVFWRVKQRPGSPLFLGKRGNRKVVFGLPGNPVSTLVCFYEYVLPFLRRITGLPGLSVGLLQVEALLEEGVCKKPGRTEFWRGKAYQRAGQWMVHILGDASSARMMPFVGCNALIVLREDASELPAKSPVPIHFIRLLP